MPRIIKVPRPPKTETVKAKTKTAKQEYRDRLEANATESEKLMCQLLTNLRISYEFQKIVCGYIPDFVIGKSIIELDGKVHKKRQASDRKRDAVLRKAGYRILRLSSHRMFWDIDRVIADVNVFLGRAPRRKLPKPKRTKTVIAPDALTDEFFRATKGI